MKNNKKIVSKLLKKSVSLEENIFHSMGDKYENGGSGVLKGLLAGGAAAAFLGDPDTAHHLSQAFHGAYDNASEFAHNAHDAVFGGNGVEHGGTGGSYGGSYGGIGDIGEFPTNPDGTPLTAEQYQQWLAEHKQQLLNGATKTFDTNGMTGAEMGAKAGNFIQNNWQYPAMLAAGYGGLKTIGAYGNYRAKTATGEKESVGDTLKNLVSTPLKEWGIVNKFKQAGDAMKGAMEGAKQGFKAGNAGNAGNAGKKNMGGL